MNFTSWECYTDESGTDKPHKFMVIGGVIMKLKFAQHLDDEIEKFRNKRGFQPGYEFKWKKVEQTNINRYKDFIDFLCNHNEYFHYKSIVINREKLNHGRFNHGDRTEGYYKFHYQLMIHCFGKYFDEGDKCFLFIDKSEVKYDINEYKNILNNGMRAKQGSKITTDVFKTVGWKDSKKSNHIQAADLLTGGLRLALNLEILDGNPRAITQEKKDLAQYILDKWKITDPFRSTPIAKQDFSIWHFRMRN